jgi:hypothetical protein
MSMPQFNGAMLHYAGIEANLFVKYTENGLAIFHQTCTFDYSNLLG